MPRRVHAGAAALAGGVQHAALARDAQVRGLRDHLPFLAFRGAQVEGWARPERCGHGKPFPSPCNFEGGGRGGVATRIRSSTLPLCIRAQLDLTASSEQKWACPPACPPACSPLWLPAEEIEEISRLDQVHQKGGEAIDGDRAGGRQGRGRSTAVHNGRVDLDL